MALLRGKTMILPCTPIWQFAVGSLERNAMDSESFYRYQLASRPPHAGLMLRPRAA